MEIRKLKKWEKVYLIVGTMVVIVGLFTLLMYKQRNEKKVTDFGLETIGTVIDKTCGALYKYNTTYSIHFDFFIDKKRIVGYQEITKRQYYGATFVGMKYKVKYLPENPRVKSLLYLDKPIEGEWENIDKELERIDKLKKTLFKSD